jgi:transcriptional regulator with XRE-family HTH domain
MVSKSGIGLGVSPRHLSFVETGRSKPSPELLLALAEGLEVPLRERNVMLLAAGYAPQFRQTSLDGPDVSALVDEVEAYPTVRALAGPRDVLVSSEAALLVPWRLRRATGVELSMFTTLTTFGTPRDITLDDLAVELFYPADAATESILRAATPMRAQL